MTQSGSDGSEWRTCCVSCRSGGSSLEEAHHGDADRGGGLEPVGGFVLVHGSLPTRLLQEVLWKGSAAIIPGQCLDQNQQQRACSAPCWRGSLMFGCEARSLTVCVCSGPDVEDRLSGHQPEPSGGNVSSADRPEPHRVTGLCSGPGGPARLTLKYIFTNWNSRKQKSGSCWGDRVRGTGVSAASGVTEPPVDPFSGPAWFCSGSWGAAPVLRWF